MKALKLLTMMFPIHLSATLMTMMITCWRDVVATNNNAVEICEVPTSDTTKIKSGLSNSAFVFVKPHANTGATRELVEEKLKNAGIEILEEKTIDGKTIDKKGLIDQHYYSIASKATMLAPRDIPVPTDKFENAFGESWSTVLAEDRACNAMEACKRFECTPSELNEAWQQVDAVKFGGGFYCGRLSVNGKPELYVFNAFFMKMRSNYIGDDNSIHCYIVKWDPTVLSWTSFRNEVLGPTDPQKAPSGSIRRSILDQYKKLGLASKPNKGDNGVHASASPFEGLAEKSNWLGNNIQDDAFGKALLDAGISKSTIKSWFKDPQIRISNDDDDETNSVGSIFDALEDLDTDECLQKLIRLNKLN